ncbi:hypothetical protein MMC06_000109 [Schaereria dolodes]|nr:hypothetical protein [Schaereria dolodes]
MSDEGLTDEEFLTKRARLTQVYDSFLKIMQKIVDLECDMKRLEKGVPWSENIERKAWGPTEDAALKGMTHTERVELLAQWKVDENRLNSERSALGRELKEAAAARAPSQSSE